VKTIADIEADERIVAMIFADWGAGKTWLAGTFPGPAFVDTDFGMKVFKNPEFRKAHPGKAELIRYESFTDPVDKYGLFKKPRDPRDLAFFQIFDFINELLDDDDPPETIVFDSITMVQVLGMHVGMELAGQSTSGAKRKSHSLLNARAQGKVPVAVPTQADYGSEMAAFEQFMNQAILLPCNVLFLAHERAEYKGDILTKRGPYLIGSSIRAQIGRWFDEVWYLEVGGGGQRILRTESDGIITAKTRHGIERIDNPTYETIKEAFEVAQEEQVH